MTNDAIRAVYELSEIRNVLNDFSAIYRGFIRIKRCILQTGFRKGMSNLYELEQEFDKAARDYGILLKETIRLSKEIGGTMVTIKKGTKAIPRNEPNSPYTLVMNTEKKLKRFDLQGVLGAFKKNGKGFLHDYLAQNWPDDFAGFNAYIEEAETSVQKSEKIMDKLKEILEV